MQIGTHTIDFPVVLAPMAGVTDKPFRQLCRAFGAGYAVSEMLSSNPALWNSRKSTRRMDFSGEAGLVAVQIAGSEPQQLAAAARHNVANGAQVIDINMGCPAKKVCRRWAGSALLRDELLVGKILDAVVAAVDVPVTLKIRTGWHRDHVNGVRIARIAEAAGICMLAVHGRTRDMLYKGAAEYETIAAIKSCVGIPVLANGDIDSPEKALAVAERTGADGLMIGRGAQGRPWIFRQIRSYLASGRYVAPDLQVVRATLLRHVEDIHRFYGEPGGVRIARKHLRWYAADVGESSEFRATLLQEPSAGRQLQLARDYFERLHSPIDAAMASIQCRTGTGVPLARCS
ncbi:MAG TPA: tRNA dihydrouridine synthase DusB [Gammaproteobacteria bacterium]|nr:tRNA dihydrouridine synthase DusB [Gammaproteobacteria bacterium]